jgi:hypothetical protein
MSQVRANSITNAAGTGAPDFPNGLTAAAGASLASPTFTGVASFPDGSAAAPAITNTGDTNTGVYFPSADSVGVTTGGVQRLLVQNGDMTIKNRVTVSADALALTLTNDNYGAGPTLGYAYFYMGTPGVINIISIDPSTGGYGGVGISGKFEVNGTYGTAGQVLVSGGSGATAEWGSVGTATAALAYGDVGTYAYLNWTASGSGLGEGATVAGSSLNPAGAYSASLSADVGATSGAIRGSGTLSGTWRAMGRANITSAAGASKQTVWLRIS